MSSYWSDKPKYSGILVGLFLVLTLGLGATLGIVVTADYALSAMKAPWYAPPKPLTPFLLILSYAVSALICARLWNRQGEINSPYYARAIGIAFIVLQLLWPFALFTLGNATIAVAVLCVSYAAVLAMRIRLEPDDRILHLTLRAALLMSGYFLVVSAALVYLNL